MRVMFEPWFVQYRVDVVFSGHVHAYERSVSARDICSKSLVVSKLFGLILAIFIKLVIVSDNLVSICKTKILQFSI